MSKEEVSGGQPQLMIVTGLYSRGTIIEGSAERGFLFTLVDVTNPVAHNYFPVKLSGYLAEQMHVHESRIPENACVEVTALRAVDTDNGALCVGTDGSTFSIRDVHGRHIYGADNARWDIGTFCDHRRKRDFVDVMGVVIKDSRAVDLKNKYEDWKISVVIADESSEMLPPDPSRQRPVFNSHCLTVNVFSKPPLEDIEEGSVVHFKCLKRTIWLGKFQGTCTKRNPDSSFQVIRFHAGGEIAVSHCLQSEVTPLSAMQLAEAMRLHYWFHNRRNAQPVHPEQRPLIPLPSVMLSGPSGEIPVSSATTAVAGPSGDGALGVTATDLPGQGRQPVISSPMSIQEVLLAMVAHTTVDNSMAPFNCVVRGRLGECSPSEPVAMLTELSKNNGEVVLRNLSPRVPGQQAPTLLYNFVIQLSDDTKDMLPLTAYGTTIKGLMTESPKLSQQALAKISQSLSDAQGKQVDAAVTVYVDTKALPRIRLRSIQYVT